ncbi:MAG: hypothetical protein GY865_20210, partial [candidate division Zixibacteria bacterium]|nr:hypothetical protein [candidate division Zixibacteria bacterium]
MSCLGQHTAQIDVVYPKKNATIGAVDSSFILGSVSWGYDLFINDIPVPVHQDGGFLAFLPLKPGNFVFNIKAVLGIDTRFFSSWWEESASLTWPVYVPEPIESFGYDSLQISDTKDSTFSQILTTGDKLIIEFQATPDCNAWFSIPGIVDSVPMAETAHKSQAYWGETVFGIGAVPDSLKIKGNYKGFYDIGYDKTYDSSRICYFLKGPDKKDIYDILLDTPADLLDYDFLRLIKSIGKTFIDSSSYFIQINPDNYPCTVELIDSVSIIRVGPRKGYLSI